MGYQLYSKTIEVNRMLLNECNGFQIKLQVSASQVPRKQHLTHGKEGLDLICIHCFVFAKDINYYLRLSIRYGLMF